MKRFLAAIAILAATSGSSQPARAGGYKLDIPGLGTASISQSAAECGEGKGAGAIVGQINPSHGMQMPHFVSISPMNASARAFVQSMHDTLSAPKGASPEQIIASRTAAQYKQQGEEAVQMQDVRGQMKQALVTPDGHFACRRLPPGRYEVMTTIYQKVVPRAPYDKLGLKEMLVINFFGQEVEIPAKSPSATVRADHFALLGSAPAWNVAHTFGRRRAIETC